MTAHRIYDTDADVQIVANQLWSVKNCFSKETFDELASTHLNRDDSWHRHQDCLEYRLQLTPESPMLKKLQDMLPVIQTELEKITGLELLPADCKMWLDLSNWHCPVHCDDQLLTVTYQVYLWAHGDVHGTAFVHSDPHTQLDFVPNTGYINLNTDTKLHHVPRITGTRLSACWQFRSKV
jgi:hypothetical protein